MAVKKKKISIEGHYEKSRYNSKRVWALVFVLLVITGAVLAMGINQSRERQARIQQEVEQHYSEVVEDDGE